MPFLSFPYLLDHEVLIGLFMVSFLLKIFFKVKTKVYACINQLAHLSVAWPLLTSLGVPVRGPADPAGLASLLERGLAVHWPRLARGSLHAASLSLFSAGSQGSIS